MGKYLQDELLTGSGVIVILIDTAKVGHPFFFVHFLAMCGMWDLSSPTRDPTYTLCFGTTKF